MVVNEGEIDLYMNFACSCKLHNISLSNVIIFAGSRYASLFICIHMYIDKFIHTYIHTFMLE